MQKSEAHVQDLLAARTPHGYAAYLQQVDSGVCGAVTACMAEEDNGMGVGVWLGKWERIMRYYLERDYILDLFANMRVDDER